MPHIINAKVVILWEHEVIAAAQALEKVLSEGATAEDLRNALNACLSAIHSPELVSGKCTITVMCAHRLLSSADETEG